MAFPNVALACASLAADYDPCVFDQVRQLLSSASTSHSSVAAVLALGIPVLSFLAGLAIILGLPPDYFMRKRSDELRRQHRGWRLLWLALRNLLGGVIFVAGVIMALPLVPGPGLLFMLIGLGLVDLPGKRALELRLLRQRHVLRSVNRVRARFGRKPLQTAQPEPRSVVDNRPCP